ncbi:MAG: SdrD B-like domain-containing protein, partial [Candidatus Electrothrix sp.]
DRVWLDENGDGIQDAGEAGISGVTVYIDSDKNGSYDTGEPTAVTDSNGNYLFKEVTTGTHTVRVDDTTLPTGLELIFDEDNKTNLPDGETSVSLTTGGSHLTADFGYNWVTKDDTDDPEIADTGAIGDRIWNDADGDGVQDPGEIGIVGVTVTLLTDDDGDGEYGDPDDNSSVTITTDADGRYIFDGLAPGSYVVEVDSSTLPTGYNTTPSGDPDSDPDGRTTTPVVLAPGDVFVNADFGYNIDNDSNLATAESGGGSAIGDTIYLDVNADGSFTAGTDQGIGGVSVVLKDSNDKILATATTLTIPSDLDGDGTDEPVGSYLFPGLPNGTYTVKVVDNGNLLDGLSITADPDGGADSQSSVILSGDDPDQDFGYAPIGHTNTDGLIGDTIFLDSGDGSGGLPDGIYNAGEGIEGVTVRLYDNSGALVAMTVTDANGRYEFGKLTKTAIYEVRVDTDTLPNGGIGLSNSVDPESDADSRSIVDLDADADGIVLDRDFGYTADIPNTISGTIWNDSNADGTLTDGASGTTDETGNGVADVTVVLRDSKGNIVATTKTNGFGNYSFDKLPDGTYTVDVVDTSGILDGFWHSVGPNAGVDNNSQSDPYTVTVNSGNRNDTTGDFGYYRSASAVGNFIWEDANGDGIFDSGSENPIPPHKVTLVITYPNGDVVALVTETDINGEYSFANLLADETYQSSGSGINQPIYVIKVGPPEGMVSTHTPATDAADADNQADNPEGEFVALTKGEVLDTKDFGFRNSGSIGDYIWLDINNDGVQDSNEPPLGGVTVKLYRGDSDDIFEPESDDGVAIAMLTTGVDGKYLFENLPAGTYWVQVDSGVPTGLEVTDDSNHSDVTDQTRPADKVVLTAGQQDDTVDFGFTATQAMLGDTVWFDADGNGIQDSGEIGINGVKLYICLNDVDPCNGTNDIDTTSTNPTVITGADGTWLQTGLNPDATYTVSVDTSSLPSGLNLTPTNNGGKVRTVYTLPSSGGVLFADYGFTDDGTVNYGTIGDRVYFDTGNNSTDDGVSTDPGIAGVLVDLLVNDGGTWKTVAQATTDSEGKYLFSGLVEGTDYKVQLNSTNSSLSGLTGTQQPTGGAYSFTPSSGTLNKTDAKFGFFGAGIGDYVWFDEDGDGVQGATESGISGVEVELYLDNGGTAGSYDSGDTLIRSTTTDSGGHYLFTGLAIGQKYVVKITSPLSFTSTTGGNEKAVSLGSATDLTVDFGLKGGSYSIGDKVWFDTDEDGTVAVDGSEVGIDGVTVDLYLNGVRIATTVTASGGAYSFNNLPSGSYEVRITDQNNLLSNLVPTTLEGSSKNVVLSSGSVTGINFGWNYPVATYATVSSFNAYINEKNQVVLEWKTSSEIGTIGFLLERLNEQSGNYQAVNKTLLPGMLSPPHGGTYRFIDTQVEPGRNYTYRIVEVAVHDRGTMSGPYTVQASAALPVNTQMFAGQVEGYTLTHQNFSRKQLKRFAARDVSEMRLASAKKKQTGTTLKIPVSKDGLVYLSTANLAAASGLSEEQVVKYVKAKKCLVTLAGTSVPVIYANTGSGFWFYGRAPERNDIGQNIYLLELGEKGVKMKNTPGRAEEIVFDEQSFAAHIQVEENYQPFHLYINTPVKDFWAWEYLMPYSGYNTVTHTLDVPYLSGYGTAVVTVNLVGVMSTGSLGSVPYKVAVLLNDVSIGTAEWSAVGDYQFQAEVPANLLSAEGNEVKLISQLNSGIAYSLIYFESIELDYERDYQAVNGELIFSDGGYDSVTVYGFRSSQVLALDITDPDTPVRVRTLPGKNDLGEYTVTVRTEPGHEYFMTENIASTVSGELLAKKPSYLRNSSHQADYLVISPLNLTASAERLVQLRESQGLKSMLVDIEDIQDEFSHSLAAPEAVRNFLAYIYEHWTQVPKYVVLIGDGSYDYRNYLHYGYPLVPSLLVQTPDGFFPSDNAFADVVGNDRVPEFAIGRIPVVDTAELEHYIDKLTVYEQSLSKREPLAVVVTDRKDLSAGDFLASGDKVATLMPEGFATQRLDVDTLGETGVHSGIVTALEQGANILHYIGHSSLIAYGRKSSLLTADDIDKMSSIDTPLLMVSMACSTASFGYPPMNSIGESAVLKADGAAVGFYGATGLSFNYQADIIAKGFYTSLFDPANTRVGDAVMHGKENSFTQGAEASTLDIYNLLGDPAMLAPVGSH